MKTGTIIKLNTNCLGNKPGTIGVCYEEYNIGEPGAGSVIFENGNYDGFSPSEQKDFLEVIGFDNNISNYKFTNVIQLSRDFENGKFNSIFKK